MTKMSSHELLAKFLLLLSTFFLVHKNTNKSIWFILHVILNRYTPNTVKAGIGIDLALHQWYARSNFRRDVYHLSLPSDDKG